MNDTTSLAVVRRYMDALTTFDSVGMAADLSDDVVFEIPFAPSGFPTRMEGRPTVAGFMSQVAGSLWSEIHMIDVRIRGESDPERVIAEYRSEGVFLNGRPYSNSYVTLFEVVGEKLTHIREFFNPLEVLAGLSAEDPG